VHRFTFVLLGCRTKEFPVKSLFPFTSGNEILAGIFCKGSCESIFLQIQGYFSKSHDLYFVFVKVVKKGPIDKRLLMD
jgi:hypothetical protein